MSVFGDTTPSPSDGCSVGSGAGGSRGRTTMSKYETDARIWQHKYETLKISFDKDIGSLKQVYEEQLKRAQLQNEKLQEKLDLANEKFQNYLLNTTTNLQQDMKKGTEKHLDQLTGLLEKSMEKHGKIVDTVIGNVKRLLPPADKIPKRKGLTVIQAEVAEMKKQYMLTHHVEVGEAQVQDRIKKEIEKDQAHFDEQFWNMHLKAKLPTKKSAEDALKLIESTLVESSKQLQEIKAKLGLETNTQEKEALNKKVQEAESEGKRLVEERNVIIRFMPGLP